jgi:hypothetical protein
MTCKWKSIAGCLSLLLIALLVTSCHHQKPMPGMGDEWRSWSVDQRQAYVSAYLDGQSAGQSNLCRKIQQEAEIFKLHNDTAPFTDPCEQLVDKYSHVQRGYGIGPYTNAYTSVIDAFYEHPECRMMPYFVLIEHLTDKEYKSGEELFKYVRSGPDWGSFSIDGIDKCLSHTGRP